MAEDGGGGEAEGGQEGVGVAGELLEGVLVGGGFGGFAEADLVGDDDAVAVGGEDARGLGPGCAAEVFAVEEDDGLVCRGGGVGGDVHVGHRELLLLGGDVVVVDGPWVGVVPFAGWDYGGAERGIGEGHQGRNGRVEPHLGRFKQEEECKAEILKIAQMWGFIFLVTRILDVFLASASRAYAWHLPDLSRLIFTSHPSSS